MVSSAIKQIPLGLRMSIRNFLQEIRIFYKHRRGIRQTKQFIGIKHLKLHIGCGENIKDGWINIDLSAKAEINLDMREPLPFVDNSCAIIYSEHFLEHLDYPESAVSFLQECFRVLEVGGIFNCVVPDTEWPLQEYCGLVNRGYFSLSKEKWHPPWCVTEMEQINYHFRQGSEHRFAYDYNTLSIVLKGVGFKEIVRREFNSDLDSVDREIGSLYVVAKK
jgi:predicted SAM-dependent methyltransferase